MPIPRLAWLAAACLLVAACGGSAPSPVGTSSPSSLVSPSPGSSLAAVSSAPSSSPSPAATVVVTPSPSSAPTASPTATPTAAPTPAPTKAPTPVPTRTAAPTVRPTAKPTGRPTPPPTPRPTARPTPPPTPQPVVIALEARDFLFNPTALTAPADAAFRIAFTNSDQAIIHNVTIATQAGAFRFMGSNVVGVATVFYEVPPLPANTYGLGCIVHPAMTGTIIVR